ncbi:MAG TPA: class I SAM-dependent methyltransferase [Verrucomicrobiae bacterium]|nr:class I SAM-dependent methyltransferase [Verrucomicrobiae bacterium]
MSTSQQAPQVTPERFFRAANAFQLTGALKAAIELDVFTAIGEGADSPDALAKRCKADARALRILCDYLSIHEFLQKNDSHYSLAPDSAAFLDSRSPMYLGNAMKFLAGQTMIEPYFDLTTIVRRGGAAPEEQTVVENNPLWVDFARSMSGLMVLPSEMIAGILSADAGEKWKVLDIAAGHGLFGIALAKHNPNAQIYAADWAPVLEVAAENAQKAGVASRYHKIPGDAFKSDFGGDYDVVLLTNFLHHFDPPTNEGFLRKVHAALKPGGRAVTLEFVPNEDRISPPMAATFSMIMLGSTSKGDAYPFSEYQRMFRNAGFASSELRPIPPAVQSVIISKK